MPLNPFCLNGTNERMKKKQHDFIFFQSTKNKVSETMNDFHRKKK